MRDKAIDYSKWIGKDVEHEVNGDYRTYTVRAAGCLINDCDLMILNVEDKAGREWQLLAREARLA